MAITCAKCGEPIQHGEPALMKLIERPGPIYHSACAAVVPYWDHVPYWDQQVQNWAGSDDMSYLVRLRRVGNTLEATTFDGWLLTFDWETGAITKREFVK